MCGEYWNSLFQGKWYVKYTKLKSFEKFSQFTNVVRYVATYVSYRCFHVFSSEHIEWRYYLISDFPVISQ